MKINTERKPTYKRQWNKNWSGRGTEIMNTIEKYDSPISEIEILYGPSDKKKLDLLLTRYPNNEFYKSLKDWMSSGRLLTDKQRQVIDNTFYKISW